VPSTIPPAPPAPPGAFPSPPAPPPPITKKVIVMTGVDVETAELAEDASDVPIAFVAVTVNV
jgi:hypothetical protein